MSGGKSARHIIVSALVFASGCGEAVDGVPGRVAIDVTLTIEGQVAEDGTLILRPGTGVACPLVKLAIRDGEGSLDSSAGPVPGQWTATFRSDAEGSLTEQLENSGRSNPLDNPNAGQFGSSSKKAKRPLKSAPILISDDDPATVEIDLSRS